MAKEFLHDPDIITRFRLVGCEGMAQDMAAHRLGQPCLECRLLYGLL